VDVVDRDLLDVRAREQRPDRAADPRPAFDGPKDLAQPTRLDDRHARPRIPPPTARGLYEREREGTRSRGTAAIPTDVGPIDSMPSGTGSNLTTRGGELRTWP